MHTAVWFHIANDNNHLQLIGGTPTGTTTPGRVDLWVVTINELVLFFLFDGILTSFLGYLMSKPNVKEQQITIGLHLSRCRVALRSVVLSAVRIWPSVSRYLEISFGLRGPSPQVFTPFWGGFHRPVPEVPLIRGMPTWP